MNTYIYQQDEWPDFTWDDRTLSELLGKVRNMQGHIVGKMESLGFNLQNEAELESLSLDVLKSSEIEGELLNPEQVRSSIARSLGMDISGMVPSDRNVDGVVEMQIDATRHFNKPLTKQKLFDWHASLFPTGRSGLRKIITGNWRDDSSGPMQVVSGGIGREKLHFQAPDSECIENEITAFLNWFNNEQGIDLVIKAGVAHIRFLTIHPFEDGNGRIARAITDMLLTRADGIPRRYYSMSSQVRKERNHYYSILEKTQKGTLEITQWLDWFLNCLINSLTMAHTIVEKVIFKHNFWVKNALKIHNERQELMLNKLLEGFTGKVTSSKWAKITKCSPDTALRDIQDLISKGILQKGESSGRSTSYKIAL